MVTRVFSQRFYSYALSITSLIITILVVIQLKERSNWHQERAFLLEKIYDNNKTIHYTAESGIASATGIEGTDTNYEEIKNPSNIVSNLLSSSIVGSEKDIVFRMHQVIYKLGILVNCKEKAVPVIDKFLSESLNRNYCIIHASSDYDPQLPKKETNDVILGYKFSSHPRAVYDFVFPPTLRIGLIEVLGAIGGEKAESVLYSLLNKNNPGVEIYCAYRCLERLAPGRYRSAAVEIAKIILGSDIIKWSEQDVFREKNNDYLFLLLTECRESTAQLLAKRWLIDRSGHINQNALEYCIKTFQDKSVPLLETVYDNTSLGDVRERMYVAGIASNYFGKNDEANKFIVKVINDDNIPNTLRIMMVQTINGYNMYTKKYVDLTTDDIVNRIEITKAMIEDQKTQTFLKEPLQHTLSMLQKKIDTVR